MKYFKNAQLARLYNVSEKTIRNWIDSAQEKNLDIYTDERGKNYVADTTHNELIFDKLVEKGKKYRNSLTHKAIKPSADFYKAYSEEQIVDIVMHLKKYKEIPFQYCHVGKGADFCEQYYQRLKSEASPNIQTVSVKMLDRSLDYIQELVLPAKKLNLIEIGGRNGIFMKELLKKLYEKRLLNAYVAIDISNDMLERLSKNIETWLNGAISVEKYNRDINRHLFDDILFKHTDEQTEGNIISFLGGTLPSFTTPNNALQIINRSLRSNDVFVTSTKLDTERSRRYFDFNAAFQKNLMPLQEKALLDLLGIDETMYKVEALYDEQSRSRIMRARLKFDITIEFETLDIKRTLNFSKGEAIIMWRFLHFTSKKFLNLLDKNNFDVLYSEVTGDQQYMLTVSRIKPTNL